MSGFIDAVGLDRKVVRAVVNYLRGAVLWGKDVESDAEIGG